MVNMSDDLLTADYWVDGKLFASEPYYLSNLFRQGDPLIMKGKSLVVSRCVLMGKRILVECRSSAEPCRHCGGVAGSSMRCVCR